MRVSIAQLGVVIILAVLSLLPVLPFLSPNAIISSGESAVYLNSEMLNFSSMWEGKINYGSPSVHQPNFYFFNVFWKVLQLINLGAHPSVIWYYLSFFLSSTSFYLCLKKVGQIKSNTACLIAAIFYTFNVFRTLGPLNLPLNLLFIVMPFSFCYYHLYLYTRKYRYFAIVCLTLILSGTIGTNLPVYSLTFLILGAYFIWYLRSEVKDWTLKYKLILMNLALLSIVIIGSLHWMMPLIMGLLKQFTESGGGKNIFSALVSGTVLDHFRLIGFWGWRSPRYIADYYPFHVYYDRAIILFLTFLIPVIGFSHLSSGRWHSQIKVHKFFTILALIAIALAAGLKDPFGELYGLFYEFVPFVRMFREPFTKFIPVYIFSLGFLIAFAIDSFLPKFRKPKPIYTGFLFLIILVMAKPILSGEALPTDSWNREHTGSLIVVPEYWKQAGDFFANNNRGNGRIWTHPYSSYGSSYNWDHGASVAGNMAQYLLDQPLATLNWPLIEKTNFLITPLYQPELPLDTLKLLGTLNISYVLQENDLDWRYENNSLSPSQSEKYLRKIGLSKVASFGNFTRDTLEKIEDLEPNPDLHSQLPQELTGRSALDIYEVPLLSRLPKIYSTTHQWKISAGKEDIPWIISSNDYTLGTPIILNDTQDGDEMIINPTPVRILGSPIPSEVSNELEWPTPAIDPDSSLYTLVSMRENIENYFARQNNIQKVDLDLWHAKKRLAEIESFHPDDSTTLRLLGEYEKLLGLVLGHQLSIPVPVQDNEFWDRMNNLHGTVIKSEKIINATNRKDTAQAQDIRRTHQYFKDWLLKFKPLQCSGEVSYLKLLKNSSYQFKEIGGLGSADEQILISDLSTGSIVEKYDRKKSNLTGSIGMFENKGPGEYLIHSKTMHDKYVLDENSWNLARIKMKDKVINILSEDSLTKPFTGSHFDSVSQMTNHLTQLETNTTYEISFDYKVNSGLLGIVVGEDGYDPSGKNAQVLNFRDEFTYTDPNYVCDNTGEGLIGYRKTLTTSSHERHPFLYLYTEKYENGDPDIDIKNLSVTTTTPRKFVLFQQPEAKTTSKIDSVNFQKVTDWDYTGVMAPSDKNTNLVFIENFNPNWGLYLNGQEVPKSLHIEVNGFANAWSIPPSLLKGSEPIRFEIKYRSQTVYEKLLLISKTLCLILSLSILADLVDLKRVSQTNVS